MQGGLPTALDGVSVMVGGQSAYVAYLSATQINILLPNVGFGALQITVTTAVGASAPFGVTSQACQPAFFPWPNNQPVATHLDYSYAVANGTFPGTTTVPAKPGETIILWGTGFGPTVLSPPAGSPVPSTDTYSTPGDVSVTLNGAPIAVYNSSATLTPGYAGLYQIAVTVPTSLPDGSYSIIASINGASSPTMALTVHN